MLQLSKQSDVCQSNMNKELYTARKQSSGDIISMLISSHAFQSVTKNDLNWKLRYKESSKTSNPQKHKESYLTSCKVLLTPQQYEIRSCISIEKLGFGLKC